MKAILVACLGAIFSVTTFAVDSSCSGKSAADKKCQEERIREEKIILPGGHYSDADKTSIGTKTECCWEKMKDPKAYAAKYGSDKSSPSSGAGQKDPPADVKKPPPNDKETPKSPKETKTTGK